MGIIEKLLHPAASWREEQKEKIRAEAADVIQAREWDGRLWLSFRDAPIVPEKSLNVPLVEAVAACREAYVRWREGAL